MKKKEVVFVLLSMALIISAYFFGHSIISPSKTTVKVFKPPELSPEQIMEMREKACAAHELQIKAQEKKIQEAIDDAKPLLSLIEKNDKYEMEQYKKISKLPPQQKKAAWRNMMKTRSARLDNDFRKLVRETKKQ
ncbi:MAG: hypothetical protein BWY26_00800 [Elusimicrobia bacterium ADurb.Bin231]|nr:MAG: hypothetical protein BWY26_00800 [Elusimicrobia bacterium ADurb.Bin231]